MTDLTEFPEGANLATAIAHIQNTSAAAVLKPELRVVDTRGNDRVFIFNYAEEKYEELDPYKAKTDTVSNINSFITLVNAEARRRNNGTGENMNVIFTEQGATFIADTDDRRDIYKYERKNSAQWQRLTSMLNKPQRHAPFLLWLQQLEPSLQIEPNGSDPGQNFSDLFGAFRSLQVSSAAKIKSEPMIVNGSKGSSIEFQLDVKGGTASIAIPQSFRVKLPFARGDEREYEFEVQIDVNAVDGEAFTITAIAPAVEVIREQAIVDEMEDFAARTTSLSDLTNLVNF